MATRPVANDDILRLRAALDVALTTLSSCAHENTNAATHSNDAPAPANQHDAPNMSSSSAGANMECSDADCREELVARIKHLEEHILKKSVEEVELAQKMMEQENIMANQTTQVQEYEQKLAEALPLLESLEQSRDETKEARRKASLATEQNVQLRHTNKHLEEEVVRLKQAREEAAATQADLEKQLESEREESLWLSEVEACEPHQIPSTNDTDLACSILMHPRVAINCCPYRFHTLLQGWNKRQYEASVHKKLRCSQLCHTLCMIFPLCINICSVQSCSLNVILRSD